MTLVSNLTDFATAVSTQVKTLRVMMTGSSTGSLASLVTTDKSSLIAAINEAKTNSNVPTASETVQGKVELATAAETATGTDATRAVHPAGLKPLLDAKANTSALAQVATTGNAAHLTGVLNPAQIPQMAITSVQVVATAAARLALANVQAGDVVKQTDTSTTWILAAEPASTAANWVEIEGNGDVTSVAGRTGAVVLTKADVGLPNVDNTSDAAKPISTAVSTALAGKAATTHGHALTDANITGILPIAQVPATVFHTAHLPEITEVNGLTAALAGKAASAHTHDDRYYTKTEIGDPETDFVATFNAGLA